MKRAEAARERLRKRVECNEREHDEQILAAILSLAASGTARVMRGQFFVEQYDAENDEHEVYACCAIGAGVLYKGLYGGKRNNDDTACDRFAKAYGVSKMFAYGVSDGFEEQRGITTGWDPLEDLDGGYNDEDEDEYNRGWAVGSAVASALRLP